MTCALFLDRDGVINHDTGYVHRIDDFRFMDGIFDLARTARALGMQLHVVTNQAGIARGYYSEDDFIKLSHWMTEAFAAQGAPLTAVHFCPFHAEHGVGHYRADSSRRKPEPGMLLDAAAEYGLDLAGSAMVGDQATDMQAAAAAGLKTWILLPRSTTEVANSPDGTQIVASLADAATLLRAGMQAGSFGSVE